LPSNWVKLINNSDADIVNLHWIQRETMSIKDISKIKKPIVWTLHDMWAFCGAEHHTNDNRWRDGYYSNNRPNYESGFDLNRWTWNRKKKYWKTPIQIVTPSAWLAKCVSESALMKNWPVSVIPNPIDTDQWTPMDKKKARQLLNLSQDANLILFGAAGGEKNLHKGYDLLLSALEYVKADKKIKKIELVVFGQSKPKSQPDLGFPIHYFGHLNNDLILRTLYSAADVMVVPSRQDNLPNTAVEAQACGTPVVSFNIGGLPDIIDHQKTGYVARAFDIRDLANGIIWVLEQGFSSKLSNNARKRAVEKFSEKKIAEHYVNIYKKLCKEI
jgi:glycosyltransferase involved in cell wall biosynthesis